MCRTGRGGGKEPFLESDPHGVEFNFGIDPDMFSHFIRLLLMSGFFIDVGFNMFIWCVLVTDSVCISAWCVLVCYGLTFVDFGGLPRDIAIFPRQ